MKKLVFGFVAVVAFGLNVNAKEIAQKGNITNKETFFQSESKGDDLVKISVHLKWGRVSKKCAGLGICDFYIEIDVPIEGVFFLGSVNANGNLQLEVTKLGMESISKSFGGRTIVLEEDFKLSSEVCKQIGLKEGYIVKAGKYTVMTDRSGVNTVTL